MVVIWSTNYTFGVFFKPLQAEFGWTRALTSGAVSLSMVVSGLIGVVMGGLTDKFGPRFILTVCGLLLGAGYLLMSRIGNAWQLYLFYGVIVGMGMGSHWVPLLSTIARWFTRRRNSMTGFVLTGTGIGAIVGPQIATRFITDYDWRISYIILGSVILVIVVLAAQLLKRDPSQVGQLPYGEYNAGIKNIDSGMQGFSPGEALHTTQFWLLGGMMFSFGYNMFALVVHIIPHATDTGISAASAASILSVIGAMLIIGRLLMGITGDKIGNRMVYLLGFFLMSVTYFLLISADNIWMFYLIAVIYGIAQGGMGVAQSPIVANLFGLRKHGLILSIVGLPFTIGGTVGPYVTGYIFDVTESYTITFLICAALSIMSIILTYKLTPTQGKSTV